MEVEPEFVTDILYASLEATLIFDPPTTSLIVTVPLEFV